MLPPFHILLRDVSCEILAESRSLLLPHTPQLRHAALEILSMSILPHRGNFIGGVNVLAVRHSRLDLRTSEPATAFIRTLRVVMILTVWGSNIAFAARLRIPQLIAG